MRPKVELNVSNDVPSRPCIQCQSRAQSKAPTFTCLLNIFIRTENTHTHIECWNKFSRKIPNFMWIECKYFKFPWLVLWEFACVCVRMSRMWYGIGVDVCACVILPLLLLLYAVSYGCLFALDRTCFVSFFLLFVAVTHSL